MIINTNHVRYTFVYHGVLYAFDFSYLCRPISIKDLKIYPDTTSDDVLLVLFYTSYKPLQSINPFIEVVNDRSKGASRIQIDSLFPKHPSTLQIITIELIRIHII